MLRFWFDRGADGVRIDSAALLVKDASLADFDPEHPEDLNFVPRFSEVARALILDADADPLAFAVQLDEDEWSKVLELYGFSLGESPASPGFSPASGEQSRPISPSTSESTPAGSSTEA